MIFDDNHLPKKKVGKMNLSKDYQQLIDQPHYFDDVILSEKAKKVYRVADALPIDERIMMRKLP